MKYLLVVFLLLPLEVMAFDEWDKPEIVMEAAYLTFHVIDWGQTLDIADECSRGLDRYESNPLLNDHPSRREVNTFFAVGLIAQPIIAHILPHEWRKAWIASGLAIEVSCVANNHSIGLRMEF